MKIIDFSAIKSEEVKAAVDEINQKYASMSAALKIYDFSDRAQREMAKDAVAVYEGFLDSKHASVSLDMLQNEREYIEYVIGQKRKEAARLRREIPTDTDALRAQAEREYAADKSRS